MGQGIGVRIGRKKCGDFEGFLAFGAGGGWDRFLKDFHDFCRGEGRTGVGNDCGARRCNLEMRKKLEKESKVLTGVSGEEKELSEVYDYVKNMNESQGLANVR